MGSTSVERMSDSWLCVLSFLTAIATGLESLGLILAESVFAHFSLPFSFSPGVVLCECVLCECVLCECVFL